MAPRKADQHPFNKDDEDGKLLDRIFRTAGVEGGLGAADPYSYSPAAIRMMPGFETFQKFNDTQFRKACERAASREVKRRMKTGEVPEPPRANFHAQPAAGGAAGPAAAAEPEDTVHTTKQITHDWDPITGAVETLGAEYFFAFAQLPWATQKGQLAVVVSEDGLSIDISKKKSTAALKPGALLAAFKRGSDGRALHGMNDVRTVAVHKAIKQKQQQSADPNAYVSVQSIELPWEAERTLAQYKIAQVPVENGQHEVWLYVEVKRIGDQYVPPAETPAMPSSSSPHGPRPPPPTGNNGSSGSSNNNSSSNSSSSSSSNNMDTSSPSRQRDSKRNRASTSSNQGSTASATSSSVGQQPMIVPPAGPKQSPAAASMAATAMAAAPVMTPDQVADLLRAQQQQMQQQFQQQQEAFQKKVQQDFLKMQVQLGQLHVNAAAFQSIPRGMPPPGIAMGPHFTQAQIAGVKDDDSL